MNIKSSAMKMVMACLSALVFSSLVPLTPISHAETSIMEMDSVANEPTPIELPITAPLEAPVQPDLTVPAPAIEVPPVSVESALPLIQAPHFPTPIDYETPTALGATYEAGTIFVKWDQIINERLMGYNLFLNGELVNKELITDTNYQITGLDKDSSYLIHVRAVYQSEWGEGLIVTLQGDLSPPVASPELQITGLSATGGPGKVALYWEPTLVENLAGYNVYVNGAQVNDALLTATTYDVMGLPFGGMRYEFHVEAIDPSGNRVGKSDIVSGSPTHYLVELDRWGIRNDGSDPVGTTEGINNMLLWAVEQQIHAVYLPAGTYLISKDSQINMVADMLWELPMDAIIQKETNGKEFYKTIAIEYGDNNVTLVGGWYKGDRDSHNYSKKDNQYSSGTHEGGYGIFIEGAQNVTVEGVKATHFTGDGLIIGGAAQMGADIYAAHFESGGLSEAGDPVENKSKIRTKAMFSLTKSRFAEQKVFEFSNWNTSLGFEVYFYTDDNLFISMTSTKSRERINIPEGATQMKIAINKSSPTGLYGEYWQRIQSENTIVRNSEFAYNRRQGITVGGGNHTLIENNKIHDISGIAPMSGIDVEGGFGENGHWNSNITIRKNEFWNNARYDVILYDGRGAVVEDNHLASKGAIGVAVSTSFAGDALIQNNHFDGTRMMAYHDAKFLNNKMNDSYTFFEGPNITIDGLDIVNGTLSTSSKYDGGISVSNVSIDITDNKKESGLSVHGVGATRFQNITIRGESSLRSFIGTSKAENTFDQLHVLGYSAAYGLSLPGGTYTNSEFEAAEGSQFGFVGISLPTKYVFDHVSFKTNVKSLAAVNIQKIGANVTIRNSTFELAGNNQAVSVQTAERFVFENNTINAMNMNRATSELVRINDYWDRNDPYDVLEVHINDNTISSNMAVIGIQTLYAGTGAPAYTIQNNTLNKATLLLQETSYSLDNKINP